MKKMRPIVKFKKAQRIDLMAMRFVTGDEEAVDEFDSDILNNDNYSLEERRFILSDNYSKDEMELFDKSYDEYVNESE